MPSALPEAVGGWALAPGTPPSRPRLPAGPQLAAVLGLGLGLLAPVAAALALLLHHRAWRLPPSESPWEPAPKASPTGGPWPSPTSCLCSFPSPGGNSFRTPIQEEHSDANSALAKI